MPLASGVMVVSDFDRELMRVGLGLEFWLRGRPDSDARRSAEMRVAEMQRFACEGRGKCGGASLRRRRGRFWSRRVICRFAELMMC
ncbi:hypothetical protein CCB80_10195 [Armatimonadetes bacterium Uphvl-Ar1]|nr:hypothetical protein CCB80_10195 [Armatimonadetes bacterium Uphvl-Ar1]